MVGHHVVAQVLLALEEVGLAAAPEHEGIDLVAEGGGKAGPVTGHGLGIAGVGLVGLGVVAQVLLALEEIGLAVGPDARWRHRAGVNEAGELGIKRVDVVAAADGLAVLHDAGRQPVAHDGGRVGLGGGDQGRLRQRRQHLLDHFLLAPALGLHEMGNGLLLVDAVDDVLAHMLMRKAQRVAGLVAHHAVELRVRGVHGEAVQVHRRGVGRYQQHIGAQVGPVAVARGAGNAHLGVGLGLDKAHVAPRTPGVHVAQDARAQVGRRAVHEADRELDALGAPVFFRQHAQARLDRHLGGHAERAHHLDRWGIQRVDLHRPVRCRRQFGNGYRLDGA